MWEAGVLRGTRNGWAPHQTLQTCLGEARTAVGARGWPRKGVSGLTPFNHECQLHNWIWRTTQIMLGFRLHSASLGNTSPRSTQGTQSGWTRSFKHAGLRRETRARNCSLNNSRALLLPKISRNYLIKTHGKGWRASPPTSLLISPLIS